MEKIIWNKVNEEAVNPKMKRKFIYGEKIMIAKMEFEDGFMVPWHSHENEQITEVYEGIIRFWFDMDEEHYLDLSSGESVIIAPNRKHKALMIGKVVETDIFSPPRLDWIEGTDQYLRK